MTTQTIFTLLVTLGGVGGMALGAWTMWRGQITLRRGTNIETLTGPRARRLGGLIFVGALLIMLIDLIFIRPLF